jgi:hypothetical protein
MLTQRGIHEQAKTPSAQEMQDAAIEQAAAFEDSVPVDGMFHFVNVNATPLVFTETLFVVIEGSAPGSSCQPAFQIQMWHVMVLHPVIDPNRTPSKQT